MPARAPTRQDEWLTERLIATSRKTVLKTKSERKLSTGAIISLSKPLVLTSGGRVRARTPLDRLTGSTAPYVMDTIPHQNFKILAETVAIITLQPPLHPSLFAPVTTNLSREEERVVAVGNSRLPRAITYLAASA